MNKYGFNTASGRHCCNEARAERLEAMMAVSIPQAVGTVATELHLVANYLNKIASFNTASGRHCCNEYNETIKGKVIVLFQYRKR